MLHIKLIHFKTIIVELSSLRWKELIVTILQANCNSDKEN